MTIAEMFAELYLVKGDDVLYEVSLNGKPIAICKNAEYGQYPNAYSPVGTNVLEEAMQPGDEWEFSILSPEFYETTLPGLEAREEAIIWYRRWMISQINKKLD